MYSKRKVFNFDTEIDHHELGTIDVHAEGFIEPKRDATLDEPAEGGEVVFTEITALEDADIPPEAKYLLEEEAIERAYEPTEEDQA